MISDTKKTNINLIHDQLKELNNSLPEKDINNDKKLKFCLSIVEDINKNLDEWNNNCPFSIENLISYRFKNNTYLSDISDELYLICGMLLREHTLTMERTGKKLVGLCDIGILLRMKLSNLLVKKIIIDWMI